MALLEKDIKRVNDKLQQLLKQYATLQNENDKLTAAVNNLTAAKSEQAHQIEQLQLQVNILKSAASQLNDAEKKGFEKNINLYIKEIDKCIALLSQ